MRCLRRAEVKSEKREETSFGAELSAGNQCMSTPKFMTAGISLNRRGVVTCITTQLELNKNEILCCQMAHSIFIKDEVYQTKGCRSEKEKIHLSLHPTKKCHSIAKNICNAKAQVNVGSTSRVTE